MNKRFLRNLMSTLLVIGVIGIMAKNHLDIHDSVIVNISYTFAIIGLLGSSLFNWAEQRGKYKGNGKRTVYIASTAYFIFIVAICIWATLEKLGIL